MMEDPELSFNREVKSGSFWMIWEDVSRHFTGMYVCNLFGEEFNQFLIQGQWKGQAAAGSHKMQRATKKDKAARPDVGTKGTHSGAEVVAALSKDYNPSGYEKPHTLVDGDARWFNNPQYRITPTEAGTQVYISLMQENHRVSKEGTKVTENLEVQAIVLKRELARRCPQGALARLSCWYLRHPILQTQESRGVASGSLWRSALLQRRTTMPRNCLRA